MATNKIPATISVTPTLVALLWRPVTGQGGYQTKIRRIQTELGIVPDESLMTTTPANMLGRIERTTLTAPRQAVMMTEPADSGINLASIVNAVNDGPDSIEALREQLMDQAVNLRNQVTSESTLLDRIQAMIDALGSGSTRKTKTSVTLPSAALPGSSEPVPERKRRKRTRRMSDEARQAASDRMSARWAAARKAQAQAARGKGKR